MKEPRFCGQFVVLVIFLSSVLECVSVSVSVFMGI